MKFESWQVIMIISILLFFGNAYITYATKINLPVIDQSLIQGRINDINSDSNTINFVSGTTISIYSNGKTNYYDLDETNKFSFIPDYNFYLTLKSLKDSNYELKLTTFHGIVNSVVPSWVNVYQVVDGVSND